MKSTRIVLAICIVLSWGTLALAAGPAATPFESDLPSEGNQLPLTKAFGDPTDFLASALAGADYVRYMQADVTEDNAGNGEIDDLDPDDGGWDWRTYDLFHSSAASSVNLYGASVQGVFRTYLSAPSLPLLTVMQDAADHMVAAGPGQIRSAADCLFLLDFATLPEVADPSVYQAAALAIWEYRIANYGGTATAFAEYIRDYRGVTNGYPNGIIPWDIAPWAEAAMKLDAIYPGMGYAAQAAEVAEVLYEDSIYTPVYFDVFGRCMGADPDYLNLDYYWYTLGVSGLIRAFETTGQHTDEIAALEAVLLDCQYPDGAFSYQYGASADFNDRGYQSSAYGTLCLTDNLDPVANAQAVYYGGYWLAAVQDVSGGWLNSDGRHYPEIGGECTAAVVAVWEAAGASLTTAVDGPDPAACGLTKTAMFSWTRADATPGLFGYEIVLQIDGPVSFAYDDFHDEYGMDYFQAVDQGAGQWSVNGTLFGAVPGILTDVDLFSLDMLTTGDGDVTIDVVSYNLREPDNSPFFADMSGAAFVVDCTAPDAVTNITAAPHHNRIAVDWDHSGDDVDHYVVFSGLWHDGAGVSVYPEYDDVVGNKIPTRPADYDEAWTSDEWDPLPTTVTVTEQDETWDDATERGVYYYEVFAVDAAGNISAPAAANDRATNYWLGDVNEDGFVDITGDITPLGVCFGTAEGQDDYDEYCDVGRTDDWSRVGVPLTDSVINFEDLMVFSMNFSVVTDMNKRQAEPATAAVLNWVEVEENLYALRLVDSQGLKGVRVRADVPVESAVGGDLLAEQGSLTFVQNVGDGLDLNLAVMGVDVGIEGQGDLALVRTTAPVAAADLTVELRDLDNRKVELKLDGSADTPTPRSFALHANYPNPFNPTTKISFSLPEAQAVTLSIYAVDGRRIATLVNEVRGAGVHTVDWFGCDDNDRPVASGTYFYRIDAGPYSQVRKMALMK